MAVDWKSLIGTPLERAEKEITSHSLNYSESEGYKFFNPPSDRYFTEWQKIFFQGSELHTHWADTVKEVKENVFASMPTGHFYYIMAPFCGDFIFVWPERIHSGNREPTELHSQICNDALHLVEGAVRVLGGIKSPPPHSIGLSMREVGFVKINPQLRGLGLSSWLFQLQELKPKTGVASGVSKNILRELFPDVNRWIFEDPTSTSKRSGNYDTLHSLVSNSVTPQGALDTFFALEKISTAFEIELDLICRIHAKDAGSAASKGVAVTKIRPGIEIEARMALGDRSKSLDLLAIDESLAKNWMKRAGTKLGQQHFPFTKKEISLLEKRLGHDCFGVLRACMKMMDDYPKASIITMASILTKHGKQREIEQMWDEVGPIRPQGIRGILKAIKTWRGNKQISDFWGLLEMLEGGKDSNFRRNICRQIGVSSDELPAVLDYIPDLITSEKYYADDWDLLAQIGEKARTIQSINMLQPDADLIQRRILLHIKTPDYHTKKHQWRLQDLIEGTDGVHQRVAISRNSLQEHMSSRLLNDYHWIRPILMEIDQRSDLNHPRDAFDWSVNLSEREYLECMDDTVLRGYIARPSVQEKHRTTRWHRPRGIPRIPDISAPDWKKKREWARLVEKPSIQERMTYFEGEIAGFFDVLSLIALALCILSPIAIVSDFNGVALSISFLSIAWSIDLLRASKNPLGDSDRIARWLSIFIILYFGVVVILVLQTTDMPLPGLLTFSGFPVGQVEVPIPNNPLLPGPLAIILWQVNRIMSDVRSKANKRKNTFLTLLGIR